MFSPRVIVNAREFGSGAGLLKLFAVYADGNLDELQPIPGTDGATVDFYAADNRKETKFFELRLYGAQEAVITGLKRKNAGEALNRLANRPSARSGITLRMPAWLINLMVSPQASIR